MTLTYEPCAACGDSLLIETSGPLPANIWCNSCHEDIYTTCDDCDTVIAKDDAYHPNGSTLCPDCCRTNYTICDRCEEDTPREDMRAVGDSTWCEYCTDNYAAACEGCGDRYPDEDMECPACLEASPNAIPLRSYCYDRHYSKLGNPLHPVYGIELELYYRDNYDREEHEALLEALNPATMRNFWIAKKDGSIDHGAEYESLPATKALLADSFAVFESRTHLLKGFRGSDNGLHVNADRPQSPLHLQKILTFCHSPKNRRFLETLGQRTFNGFCSQNPDTKVTLLMGQAAVRNLPKHSTVAALHNRLEFRFFKANMLKSRLLKAIDTVQAIIDYCKTASLARLHHNNFIAWLESNQAGYPDLIRFIVEDGTYATGAFERQVIKWDTKQLRLDSLPPRLVSEESEIDRLVSV